MVFFIYSYGAHLDLHSFPTRRSSDLVKRVIEKQTAELNRATVAALEEALKYAPAGSETVVDNLKASIAAAQNAYANLVSIDRKSTRLSSHTVISYAVFCLKKKKKKNK